MEVYRHIERFVLRRRILIYFCRFVGCILVSLEIAFCGGAGLETACSPPTESNKQVCSLVRARGEQCGRLLFIAFRAKRALQSAWAPPLISVLCSIRRLERKGMGIWWWGHRVDVEVPPPPPRCIPVCYISIVGQNAAASL